MFEAIFYTVCALFFSSTNQAANADAKNCFKIVFSMRKKLRKLQKDRKSKKPGKMKIHGVTIFRCNKSSAKNHSSYLVHFGGKAGKLPRIICYGKKVVVRKFKSSEYFRDFSEMSSLNTEIPGVCERWIIYCCETGQGLVI